MDGLPPNAPWAIKAKVRMPQERLKAAMAQLASAGPRDFYQGDLAKSLAADIQSAGGALSVEDLAAFRAHLREPLVIPYRGGKVFVTPELTAGPTLSRTFGLLQENLKPVRGAPDAAAYIAYARPSIGLSRTAVDMGDPTDAARSAPSAGAGLHHAFLGRRPRRQHGGGDADLAVELWFQIRVAETASP